MTTVVAMPNTTPVIDSPDRANYVKNKAAQVSACLLYTSVICEELYDLAMLSHKQLSPEEMTRFVQRSNEILLMLTK